MPIDGTTEGWTDGDLLRGDHHPGDHESDNRGNAKMDPLHAALFFNPCPENGTGCGRSGLTGNWRGAANGATSW